VIKPTAKTGLIGYGRWEKAEIRENLTCNVPKLEPDDNVLLPLNNLQGKVNSDLNDE